MKPITAKHAASISIEQRTSKLEEAISDVAHVIAIAIQRGDHCCVVSDIYDKWTQYNVQITTTFRDLGYDVNATSGYSQRDECNWNAVSISWSGK